MLMVPLWGTNMIFCLFNKQTIVSLSLRDDFGCSDANGALAGANVIFCLFNKQRKSPSSLRTILGVSDA